MLIVHLLHLLLGLALLYWRKPIARWSVREQNRLWHLTKGAPEEAYQAFWLGAMGLVFILVSVVLLVL